MTGNAKGLTRLLIFVAEGFEKVSPCAAHAQGVGWRYGKEDENSGNGKSCGENVLHVEGAANKQRTWLVTMQM